MLLFVNTCRVSAYWNRKICPGVLFGVAGAHVHVLITQTVLDVLTIICLCFGGFGLPTAQRCKTEYSFISQKAGLYLFSLDGRRPPLWCSNQSTWLQIQRSGFDSRRYQIFWEVVGRERGPLSLVSTIEELFVRKCSGSGLESREYGRRNPSRWPRDTLYPQKLALTSSTSGGRSVRIAGELRPRSLV
jgi:hypothetical protein